MYILCKILRKVNGDRHTIRITLLLFQKVWGVLRVKLPELFSLGRPTSDSYQLFLLSSAVLLKQAPHGWSVSQTFQTLHTEFRNAVQAGGSSRASCETAGWADGKSDCTSSPPREHLVSFLRGFQAATAGGSWQKLDTFPFFLTVLHLADETNNRPYAEINCWGVRREKNHLLNF